MRENKWRGGLDGQQVLTATTQKGFRMLVGDAERRTNPGSSMKLQNCYRCYTGPNYGGDVYAPCQGP